MAAHPAARARTLAELHRAIAGCRMCPRVTPPPILWAREGQRALIVGQAPGITEPRAACRSRARPGASSSPGSRRSASTTTRSMLERFAFAAGGEVLSRAACRAGAATARPTAASARTAGRGRTPLVRLCDPTVVVPVGRLAIDDWLGPRAARPRSWAGASSSDGRVIVPLPHPSGASAWTNDPANRALVGRRRRTAARHAPLTGRDERVTGAGPSVPARGTRTGIGGDGGPLGARSRCSCSVVAALLGAAASPTTSSRRSATALPHAPRDSRLTPDERALRNPLLRALIDRALPRLVLERDPSGDDDEVPVWTSCRQPLCARSGAAEPVLHVHVVHAAAGPVVELWTYYPDSQTSHLPLAALRGYHHDDWEGLFVAFAADGSMRRRPRIGPQRLQRHARRGGSRPPTTGRPTPASPTARAARTRSASGATTSISPATPGTAISRPSSPGAFRLVAADRVALRGLSFDPEVAPPWEKAAWRNPGTRHTSAAGAGPSQMAEAARVWAQAYALGAW